MLSWRLKLRTLHPPEGVVEYIAKSDLTVARK